MLSASDSLGCYRKQLLCPPLTAVALAALCLGSGCASLSSANYQAWSKASCEDPKNNLRVVPDQPVVVAETADLAAAASGLIDRLQSKRAQLDSCSLLPAGTCFPTFEISALGVFQVSRCSQTGLDEAAACLLDALADAHVEETTTTPVLVTFENVRLRPSPEAPVLGSLGKEDIRKVIRSHIGEVRECYEKALGVWEDFGGKVEVRFVIDPDGRSRRAKVAMNTTPHPELGCCITSRVRRWRFPEPKGGGSVIVTYPFVFRTH